MAGDRVCHRHPGAIYKGAGGGVAGSNPLVKMEGEGGLPGKEGGWASFGEGESAIRRESIGQR